MSDSEAPNPMMPDPPGRPNISRTHVMGKVPEVKPLRTRRRKAVKVSSRGKEQLSRLQKTGRISQRAAVMNGLQGAQK